MGRFGIATSKEVIEFDNGEIIPLLLQRYEKIRGARSLIFYFNESSFTIELFLYGNAHFEFLHNYGLKNLEEAYYNNSECLGTSVEDMMEHNYIREANQMDFQKLFDSKFTTAKRVFKYKTEQVFAKQEIANFSKKYNLFSNYPIYDQWIEFLNKIVELPISNLADHKVPEKITSPVKALFCHLLNISGTFKKVETETIEDFCKRACSFFNLEYKARIRSEFSNGYKNIRNTQKMQEQIFPNIPTEISNQLKEYLSTHKK